jgi:hypothetical protein
MPSNNVREITIARIIRSTPSLKDGLTLLCGRRMGEGRRIRGAHGQASLAPYPLIVQHPLPFGREFIERTSLVATFDEAGSN